MDSKKNYLKKVTSLVLATTLSCQHICYTYEKVFQNTCYFIENYKWISQGVKLRVP